MPVVRRGYHHDIKILFFQSVPEIGDSLRVGPLEFSDRLDAPGVSPAIDVRNISHLRVGLQGKIGSQCKTAAVHPHHSYARLLIGSDDLPVRFWRKAR